MANIVNTSNILALVGAERMRQRQLLREKKILFDCSLPDVLDTTKTGVLGEEYGEVCKEVNEATLGCEYYQRLQKELIQVAAVAVAWAEACQFEIDNDHHCRFEGTPPRCVTCGKYPERD